MISTDINNPECDPVELLSEFMFWVNNVKRPVSVLEKIEAFITPDVCKWLQDVDNYNGETYGGGTVAYRFYDALLLIQVWKDCGLIIRDSKLEDINGGWMVFILRKMPCEPYRHWGTSLRKS